MTVPVGLERLYFVGLAAPRGPQMPVYSAQAKLIAKLLTAAQPLAGQFEDREARIDVPRHEWQRDMHRAHKVVDRIAVKASRPAPHPEALPDRLAIHGRAGA